MIKVVYAEISERAHAVLLEKYLPGFPDLLRKKILGYRTWQDAQLSLTGTVMALDSINALANTSFAADSLEYSSSNKPFIRGSNVEFNISHSGSLAVCVISTQGEVGIDIECMNKSDLDFLFQNMTSAETQTIANAADRTQALYSYWTQKEAVLKAAGVGLIDDLCEFEITDGHAIFRGSHYRIEEVLVRQGYTCMIAIKSSELMHAEPIVHLEPFKWDVYR
jgi:4'-phosphopantetheinyl transferase